MNKIFSPAASITSKGICWNTSDNPTTVSFEWGTTTKYNDGSSIPLVTDNEPSKNIGVQGGWWAVPDDYTAYGRIQLLV